jgi:hypothetical protein
MILMVALECPRLLAELLKGIQRCEARQFHPCFAPDHVLEVRVNRFALLFLDKPDQEVAGDTVVRSKKPDARVELRCAEGDASIFDPTPDPEDLQFDRPPSNRVSAPLAPMASLKVQCSNGAERVITVIDAKAEAESAKPTEASPFSLEAGVEVPVTSTHGLMRGPGAFFQSVSPSIDAVTGVRGVFRTAWSPITQRPASDNARFHPRNPRQRFHGNALRATAGLLYPHELARRGGFSLDVQGGADVGAAFLSVGTHNDVAVDEQGDLADVPGYIDVTAVVEGHGELMAKFGDRLRVALGLRYGQSPFAVQTRAASQSGARFNFVNVNAGMGVQF